LFSGKVAYSVGLWFFHEVVPGDLGSGGSLNNFLGALAAVITWVGVEEWQFVVVSADRMEIQVRDMAEAL
jgi:glutamate/tyrosine decarboxylase-like PLP-dependent enzyme